MNSRATVDPDAVRRHMRGAVPTGTNDSDSRRLKRMKQLVPHGQRDRLRAAATAAIRPASKRTAAHLATQRPLRLNLGSGFSPVGDFVNIDLAGAPADLRWDLSTGIPFADAVVDMIYSAHVLEHLPLPGAIALFQECHRVLRPGGLVRIVVPDAGLLLGSYAGTNDASWAHEFPTRMLAVNALFYENGHRTMWDVELMVAALEGSGFTDVRERAFGDTELSPCPDDEDRRAGSLFVEGRRPGT